MSVAPVHASDAALLHRAIREVASAGIDPSGVLLLVAIERFGMTELSSLSVATGLCKPRVRSLLADLRAAGLVAASEGGRA